MNFNIVNKVFKLLSTALVSIVLYSTQQILHPFCLNVDFESYVNVIPLCDCALLSSLSVLLKSISTVYLIISMIGARVRVSYLLLQILHKERD